MTTGLDEKKIAFDHVEDAKALQRSDSDEPSHDLYSSVRPRKTSDEKQAQLKAAQAADPGLHWASMRALSFLGMLLVVCCCGGDTGLDATSEFRDFVRSNFTSNFTGTHLTLHLCPQSHERN